MQSLCQSTHLYGRRLVLEWAQSADDDLEQLRKRTAERFPAGKYIIYARITEILIERVLESQHCALFLVTIIQGAQP